MIDFALQRKNMVESQVRPSDVTDRRIMRAMEVVPRELFCPAAQAATAYRDEALQISEGPSPRFAVAPRVLARMIQALELGERDTVLEIGSGRGYATAILAQIAGRVVGVEVDSALAAAARATLEKEGVKNASIVEGRLSAGNTAGAPYDAVLISGAVEQVPRALLDQLKDGGRLVAVVIDGRSGRLTQWRRIGGAFDSRPLSDAAAPRLAEFDKAKEFVF